MKKIIIMMMFSAALFGLIAATKGDRVLLTQNFNTDMGGWTNTGTLTFSRKDSTLNLDGTTYAYLPPNTGPNNIRSGVLTSPVIDATLCSDLYVDFDHKFLMGGANTSEAVEYTTDGVTWTNAYLNEATTGTWGAPTHSSVLIPALSATMRIRIIGNLRGKTASDMAVDNIVIHGTDRIPDVPVLAAPTSGSNTTDFTPTFDWNDALAATSYTILADNNSDFSSPEINQSPTVSTYTPGTNLAAGTYYWKVLATNTYGSSAYSSTWTVNLGTPPSAPSGPSSPADGFNTSDTTPTFDWEDVPGADSYIIYIDNNPDMLSPEITGTPLPSDYTPGTPLAPGTYYWTVVAVNEFGESIGSVVKNFTIGSVPSVPAGPFAPTDETNTSDTTPTFDWADVPGATSYVITIDNNSDMSSPVDVGTPTGSNYTPGDDLPPGTYYWTVTAVNEFGESIGTTVISFTVGPVPVQPTGPFEPTDGFSTTDTTPTFDWADVPGADSYIIYIDNNSDMSSPEVTGTPVPSDYTPGTPLAPGTYYWTVVAVNEFGESIGTTVISFTIEEPPPNVPLNVVMNESGSDVVVSWEAVTGAVSYNIYGCSDPYGTYTYVTNVTDINYQIPPTQRMMFWYVTAVR